MNLKKLYLFSNDRQIWRLIPTGTDKLIIEERDTENREVFFNCLNIFTGGKIFSDFQFDEKFWIGIEAVYNDIIYFHRFAKPDMPGHKDIIAFDLNTQKIIWENSEYSFLFIDEDKVFCYKSLFEGRNFYSLNYKTGKLMEELGNDSVRINQLREQAENKRSFEDYIFPEEFNSNKLSLEKISDILNQVKQEKIITGRIEYAVYKENLFFNCHEVLDNGYLKNVFRIIELNTNKIILEEILNNETQAFVPDSFFLKQNLLFLIQEKVRLVVYKVIS